MDMGASSARFAAGWIDGDRLRFEVIEQVRHAPRAQGGRLCWDAEILLDLCLRATNHARTRFQNVTLGIDTWGVDIGFVGDRGLIAPAVAYRDPSHLRAMDRVADRQERLYHLTGIQRQPFNTLNQLLARAEDSPHLRHERWLLLPDLFAHLLGGAQGYETTIASTTQLVGLDGEWCEEAFDLIGWPTPPEQPCQEHNVIGSTQGVDIVRVGGHDTASAVCGLGSLDDGTAFLSTGTWSLLGTLLERPMVTTDAWEGNFTNELAVDGRVRFLRNIPGFYILNRLQEDLGIEEPMGSWIARADQSVTDRIDPLNEAFFNPADMAAAIIEQLAYQPQTSEEWAGIALMSLVECTALQLRQLEKVTDRDFSCIRMGGGGAASATFCQALAEATGVPVMAGPVEATLVGNLVVQLVASGEATMAEAHDLLRRSFPVSVYHPRE